MRKPGPSHKPRRSRAGGRAVKPSTLTSDRCLYCDRILVVSKYDQPDKLTIDHVVPRHLGGAGYDTSHPNVVLCCLQCNHAKGGRTVTEAIALGAIPNSARAIEADQLARKALGSSVDP